MPQRIMARLEECARRELDVWFCEDYKLAWNLVRLADLGIDDPYVQAFIFTVGRQPHKLVTWWRDIPLLFELARYFDTPTPSHLDDSQVNEFLSRSPLKQPPQSVRVTEENKVA